MTNNKNLSFNKWLSFKYPVENNLFTKSTIKLSLLKFKEQVLNQYLLENPDHTLLILFKIKTANKQYRNISYLQTIKLSEFDVLEKLFQEYWDLKDEEYYLAPITDVIFPFKFIASEKQNPKNKIPTKIIKVEDTKPKEYKGLKFSGFILPSTMDITNWGRIHKLDDNNFIVYKKSSNLEYHITLSDKSQSVNLMLNDKILLTFSDEMNDSQDLSTFTRTIKNQTIIYQFGEVILKKIKKNVSFLKPMKQNHYNSKKFIVMDLETRTLNGKMSCYCVSICGDNELKSFYLSDYLNETDLLQNSIKFLMKRKFHNYVVYLHNFSNFDAIFLLRIITSLSDNIRPIIKDGKIINLQFKFANKYIISFRDSLLLLPSSFSRKRPKLSKQFNVENKGIFPYKFVNNSNISLDYHGIVPAFEYFDNISHEEYNNYAKQFNNDWNLRNETIKYCELDCKVLKQVINKFSDNIFNSFRLDILKFTTLSSLAFAIFRSQFMRKNNIPLIHGEIYNFIKESYTGGSVDVFKPRPPKNTKIYRYDVNSLYPSAMASFPMPVGNPIYFVAKPGDILNNASTSTEKPFGIFEVDISCPDNINIPILQTRIKTSKGYRTISPVGQWRGKYFSDELYNASKYGYKFNIIRGYLFEKDDIFSDYVNFLYKMKESSSKESPNYVISKLLLNSLYGRLGMNPTPENHLIADSEEASKFYSNSNVKISNIIDLKNGKELISYVNSSVTDDENNPFALKNVSIVVSAVVTASARIHMSQFKTNKNISIYYSDTDSLDVDRELDLKYIGHGLGLLKLEHVFNDAIFLAPKMYGGVTDTYELVKIKGLKNPVKFNELIPLLNKNYKLEIKQEKWYSDISHGTIHIKDEIYTLMSTDSKRKLIFDNNEQFIDTKPIKLTDGKIDN
jgi:hypothetical protein